MSRSRVLNSIKIHKLHNTSRSSPYGGGGGGGGGDGQTSKQANEQTSKRANDY